MFAVLMLKTANVIYVLNIDTCFYVLFVVMSMPIDIVIIV